MPGGLVHPTTVDGNSLWMAPEVEDIVHALHYGDATLGWEGDPRLALYRTSDNRWELWRLEEDGEYRRFMRSKPNARLDNRLIMELVAHDTRRGFDAHTSISGHNARLEKERDEKLQAVTTEALEKVYHAARKDIGHHY